MTALPVPFGIVADDLTGALDAAGPFAARGWPTHVLLDVDEPFPHTPCVVAASTETRLLPPLDAAARTVTIARRLATVGLFKKMDSLLRGPFAAEIGALIHEHGPDLVVVAPAFPAQDRTTVGGVQYAHGQPVHALAARDPFAPAAQADLRTLLAAVGLATNHVPVTTLRAGRAAVVAALCMARDAGHVVVADAEQQSDLDRLAEATSSLNRTILWCGTGGLAHAVAGLLPARARPSWPTAQRALVVCGSVHPASAVQCVHLGGQIGVEMITLDLEQQPDPVRVAARVQEAFDRVRCVVVRLAEATTMDGPQARRAALTALTQIATVLCVTRPLGLVATGGDTAAALCRGFGVRALAVVGLVEEGLPCAVGRGGPRDGIPVVTKAGAFGDATALQKAAWHVLGRR